MRKSELITQIRAVAQYLKETHAPVGEKALIERILTGAVSLEALAKDLEAEEAENEVENQQGE